MTNTNEIKQVGTPVGKVVKLDISNYEVGDIVEENANYMIVVETNDKGKPVFKRKAKMQKFWTEVPTEEDRLVELFQVFNSDNKAVPFKEAKGVQLVVKNYFINPYEKVDEETGELITGATLTIEAQDGNFYVTSSKSAIFDLQNITDVFGVPNTEHASPFIIEIGSKKSQFGNDQQTIKLVGLAK